MSSPGIGVLNQNMLAAAIASGTTSEPVNCLGYTEIGVYVSGTGTCSSGVVTIETAYWDQTNGTPYTGTWSAITTVNATDVTAGATKHVPLTDSAYMWIRHRVSTAIGGGGSISTAMVGTS